MGNESGKKRTADSTQLTPTQIAFLETNTKYSEREIREWHMGFMRDCPSGKLDKKKFTEVYRMFYPGGKAEKFCKFAFETFDRNGDGSIDFEEFLLAISAASQGSIDERLGIAFNMFDISGDGQIDSKELIKLISAMYDLTGETDRKGDRDPKYLAANIMKKWDVNGDRRLSKEEFITGCKNDPHIRRILAPNT
ncbi:unnamed protein product [Rotaria magnacalcarata]|uniref:EF-hand domain-containing protein n=1 Tax=Rotaria magnacalcarata TaxID=392030 RepID=A0A815XZD2_9BILA|nr:unnamed protein product [Rotaria magnacalcarata]CAF1629437.1 unnamed protein product [Rotaria magnacalcarata]CAF1937327.1 unnamed protein product [Rotaria magnacalcarata]CAF2142046.1 unnamed protein product [Rotaria magnacalcarata]CAF3805301.1 unnamed protein product [Rotaria magnacalcarata]